MTFFEIEHIIFPRNKEVKKQRIDEGEQMLDSTITGGSIMERKLLSISSKRQITIPQKFYNLLGFGTEAECIIRGKELIIRPIEIHSDGEFAEQILEDLIKKGYSGEELLIEFRNTQKKIRPAVERLLSEAEKVAMDDSQKITIDEIFDAEEDE